MRTESNKIWRVSRIELSISARSVHDHKMKENKKSEEYFMAGALL